MKCECDSKQTYAFVRARQSNEGLLSLGFEACVADTAREAELWKGLHPDTSEHLAATVIHPDASCVLDLYTRNMEEASSLACTFAEDLNQLASRSVSAVTNVVSYRCAADAQPSWIWRTTVMQGIQRTDTRDQEPL